MIMTLDGVGVVNDPKPTTKVQSKENTTERKNRQAKCENNKEETGETNTEGSLPRRRCIKRPRRDSSPTGSPPRKAAKEKKVTGTTPETKPRRKRIRDASSRRVWEIWSLEVKNAFFEGLNEFGKDFDAIHNLITTKCKKKGEEHLVKNKEQVRHFYYRTWHKIAKYVDIQEESEVKKTTQELYALINYGELRRKVRKLDDKNLDKLRELINKGSTSVKVNGKNIRVRTPVCRALKKLNNIETETKPDENIVKLPDYVTIEFKPKNNESWVRVQTLAQNPRLRMKVKLDKRAGNVLEFLKKKWRTPEEKQNLGTRPNSGEIFTVTTPSNVTMHPLVLKPIAKKPITGIGFEAYQEQIKIQGDLTGNSPKGKKSDKTEQSQLDSKGQSDKTSERTLEKEAAKAKHEDPSEPTEKDQIPDGPNESSDIKNERTDDAVVNTKGNIPTISAIKTDEPINTESDTGVRFTEMKDTKISETKLEDDTTKTNKMDDSSQVTNNNTDLSHDKQEPSTSAGASVEPNIEDGENENTKQLEVDIEGKVQEGLTHLNAGKITIAEIYLILGKPDVITLEYEWRKVKNTEMIYLSNLMNSLQRLIYLARAEHSDLNRLKEIGRGATPILCQCGKLKPKFSSPVKGTKSPTSRAPGKRGVRSPNTSKGSQRIIAPNANSPTSPKVSVSPTREKAGKDTVFRVPNKVPPVKLIPTAASNMPEQRLYKQFNNVAGNRANDIIMARPRRQRALVRRPMVVQRTLLPKTQVPHRQMVTLTMLPNSPHIAGTGSFMPLNQAGAGTPPAGITPPKIAPNYNSSNGSPILIQNSHQVAPVGQASTTSVGSPLMMQGPIVTSHQMTRTDSPIIFMNGVGSPDPGRQGSPITIQGMPQQAVNPISPGPKEIEISIPENGGPSVNMPNLSSLLDISMPGFDGERSMSLDGDVSLQDMLAHAIKKSGIAQTPKKNQQPENPISPNKSLFKICPPSPGPETQWMNSLNGMGDFSFSQLLGGDASPEKRGQLDLPSAVLNDASRDSVNSRFDVDVQSAMQTMFSENSLDFGNKFADLAAQVAATPETPRKHNDLV
ncbi:unnamed protein product [Owenia fusiformis]|uniref:Uncharacterized protein n=1 Tax=Owenia fusiformis TaxID=6347 RepID=A0A8J1TI47_OWEFU|nr:unnamed protein product [Owenia fusiformis]